MSVTVSLPRTSAAQVNIVLPRNRTTETVVSDSSARDQYGSAVPVWLGQDFTYDANGNLETMTIVQGSRVWIKTLTYVGGVQTQDSGWVRQ